MPKYTEDELRNMQNVATGAGLMTAATIHFAAEHIVAFAGWLNETHDETCEGLCGGSRGHTPPVPVSKVRDVLAEAHALNAPNCDAAMKFGGFEEDLEYDEDGNVTTPPPEGFIPPVHEVAVVNLTNLTREQAEEWPPEMREMIAARCQMAIPQAIERGEDEMAGRLQEIVELLTELNA